MGSWMKLFQTFLIFMIILCQFQFRVLSAREFLVGWIYQRTKLKIDWQWENFIREWLFRFMVPQAFGMWILSELLRYFVNFPPKICDFTYTLYVNIIKFKLSKKFVILKLLLAFNQIKMPNILFLLTKNSIF